MSLERRLKSFSLEFKRTSAQFFGRQDAEWDKGKETSEHG